MPNLIDKYRTITPTEWAEDNISLDYGKYKREMHPLMEAPLNKAAENRGGIVGLIGSVQHIKTLCAQIWQLYGMAVEPTRAAMYDLTESAIKEFSDDKFTPLIDSTDAITRTIPQQAHRRTKFYTSHNFGFIRLLSANVLAARNSKTLERVTCDESWDFKENWLDQIKDRMSSYPWSWQMFLPSSGQTKGSELDQYWERSTQHTWHVKCDCCQEYIPYIWRAPAVDGTVPIGGMRWAPKEEYTDQETGQIDWKALGDSVYYECQSCGGRMEADMSKQAERNLSGKYIQMNPDGDPNLTFYHYNAIAHMPWPKLVEQFKLAQLEREQGNLAPLENFVRKRLAEAWSEADYVSGDVLPEAAGDYHLNDPWADEPNKFIFGSVDVQKDSYYYVVRAWALSDGTLKSRLLDRGHVVTVGELRDAFDRWNIPQHRLGTGGACRVSIDGNYNTAQVSRIALDNGWMVLRGDGARDYRNQDGIRRIYSDLKAIDAYDGTRDSSASRVAQFYFSLQSARNRLSILREQRDNHGVPNWSHASDAGDDYINQINAWAKIAKTKPDGSVHFDWLQRKRDDHYLDCEIQSVVLATMCKISGQDESLTPSEDHA